MAQSTISPNSDSGSDIVIGIDLGTTYSVVAITKDGVTQIIPNEHGNRIMPSIVGFHPVFGERYVGESAKNQLNGNAVNTIYDAKRFIGKQFSDKSVQSDKKFVPFEVFNGNNNKPLFKVQYKNETKYFSPEEISAMVLKQMKKTAETYLGHSVTKAVITVPANFDDAQRQATKDAGKIAGLEVLRIISEPTAAAIAYGLNGYNHNGNAQNVQEEERNILVVDLGGGTFDVSLLTLDEDVFEVIANGGDTHLGGEDFDHNVMTYLLKRFKNKMDAGADLSLSGNQRAITTLKREIEKAKRALSSMTEIKIEVEFNNTLLSETLTRARFEQLNHKLFRKVVDTIDGVIKESPMQKRDIDEVVLVGGSTRIPKIRQMISKYFNGKLLNRGINADEAIAYGASIQAAVLGGHYASDGDSSTGPVVIDATPLSLGIVTKDGVMAKIITKNTNYPTQKSQIFTTAVDGQTSVLIQVFQGERAMAADNRKIGEFMLNGIHPNSKRGQPEIEVTFAIDANGILDVSAMDKQNRDSKQSIVISRDDFNNLSEEEILDFMRKEQEFAEYDASVVTLIKDKNALEINVYSLHNHLESDEHQIDDEDDWQVLSELCLETLEWIDDNNDITGAVLADDATADSATNKYQEMQSEFDEISKPILGKYGVGNNHGHQESADSEYDDNNFDHTDL